MSQTSLEFRTMDAELYFVRRLGEHGKRVFEGLTTSEITRERIRRAILDSHVDCAIIGRNPATKKPETYQACFERVFSEPLVPKPKGKRP